MALSTDDFLRKHVLTQELDRAKVMEESPAIINWMQQRIDNIDSEIAATNDDLLH